MSEKQNLGSVEIPLKDGVDWAKKYHKAPASDEEGDKKTNAYLIPLESLKLVLALKDISAVRAYKGINNAGEQVLMFVGTKLDPETGIYRDVFQSGTEGKYDLPTDVVYDATRPCPPNGDPESPLFP